MSQEQENQGRRLETARECAKDFLRPLVEAHWSLNRIISEQIGVNYADYSLWIGKNKAITDQQYQPQILQCGQLVVTHVVKLDIAEIVAEIRDEECRYRQVLLVDLLNQEEPLHIELPTRATKKRAATYRSYMGGNCENCGEPLGFIEEQGGRDRHYCNTRCRVQHHRRQKIEQKRASILRYNTELRDYWQEHGVHGEVLLRLQEILLKHGKEAARAATDAVLVACEVQRETGNNERSMLIDEVLLGGESIGHEAVIFDDFRIEAGLEAWCAFVSSASPTSLRILRESLRQRQRAPQARKRLEGLGR